MPALRACVLTQGFKLKYDEISTCYDVAGLPPPPRRPGPLAASVQGATLGSSRRRGPEERSEVEVPSRACVRGILTIGAAVLGLAPVLLSGAAGQPLRSSDSGISGLLTIAAVSDPKHSCCTRSMAAPCRLFLSQQPTKRMQQPVNSRSYVGLVSEDPHSVLACRASADASLHDHRGRRGASRAPFVVDPTICSILVCRSEVHEAGALQQNLTGVLSQGCDKWPGRPGGNPLPLFVSFNGREIENLARGDRVVFVKLVLLNWIRIENVRGSSNESSGKARNIRVCFHHRKTNSTGAASTNGSMAVLAD